MKTDKRFVKFQLSKPKNDKKSSVKGRTFKMAQHEKKKIGFRSSLNF